MDRALDPEDLADALGIHSAGPLPSVEELTNLIADVEVQAFLTPAELNPRLLVTAWYLHGVASALNAGDLYTPVRQQRAFAVSAHIFDLALGGPNVSVYDLLVYAFAAQVGYHRADLDPNATAMFRRVAHLVDRPAPEPTDVAATQDAGVDAAERPENEPFDELNDLVTYRAFTTMALRAGVAFLGLNLRRVDGLVRRWEAEASEMASLLDVDTLAGTVFGPAERVVSAVGDLVAFLRYGIRDQLASARTALISVVDRSAGIGDHDARWIAAHLLVVADGLEDASVWTLFPPDAPDALAQAFTFGSPPVLTLWPPQRELLTRVGHNPFDGATRRLLLSVPTSAGKTLIAQILICHHLAMHGSDVCYVTPLRSLGREMRQALATRLRILDKGLTADLPDFTTLTVDDFLAALSTPASGAVEVMTPERLVHSLRKDPDGVLSRFSMFVIDEAHMMAQSGRGLLLEELLATLHAANAPLVLLSGVMGNAAQVATWLDDSSPDVLFTSPWRGPRRLHALLYSRLDTGKSVVTARKSKTHPTKRTTPLFGELRVRPAESHVRSLRTTAIGESVRFEGPSGWKRGDGSTAFYRQCARVATLLLKAGSLLMIVSQRDYSRDAAIEIAKELATRPQSEQWDQTAELVEFLVERLGAEHPLIGCVRHGVAYHHAGLPVDVLDSLEQAIRDERLRAMVATTTLTDGVNLPVRTVLIAETKYSGQDPAQQLDAAQLLNAVGRAGRAGRETEGWVVLAVQQPGSNDFDLLRPADEDLGVVSTLGTDGALGRLADAEDLIRDSADALFNLDKGEAADFVSWVWFLLSATERLQAVGGAVSDLRGAVTSMLAFTQLPPDITERWLALAQATAAVYAQTAESSRHRWTVAGTTLSSARALEALAEAVADQVAADVAPKVRGGGELEQFSIEQTMAVLDRCGVFVSLLGLPEAEKEWVFRSTPRGRTRIEIDVTTALRGWMAGLAMPELAALMLPTVSKTAWQLEQAVDAVGGAFEHLLAWMVGVVVEQANDQLTRRGLSELLAPQFASMIRYGVDTDQALVMMLSGVASRRVAYRVGREAEARGLRGADVVRWLDELHIDGWAQEFDASPRETEDLAVYVRDRGTVILREMLEQRRSHADLRYAMDPLPPSPFPVVFRGGDAHLPIEVWTPGPSGYRVGVVAAHHHSDTAMLLGGGISYTATVDGMQVALRRV